MFEKYNLVHFEVTHPMSHNNRIKFENAIKALENEITQQQLLPFSEGEISDFTHGANYQISGSFDFLLPAVRKNAANEFFGNGLFLQSLCLMNCASDYFTRREGYASLLFSFTYSGKGSLTCGGKTYTIDAGTGFVIDCRLLHEYHSTADHWEHIDIHLWGEQAEAFLQCYQRLGVVSFTHSAAMLNHLLEELLEAYTNHFELRDVYVSNALSALLCAVLKKSEIDGASNIPIIYKHIAHYMERHYMDALSQDDLAERFHISKYHMSREFRKHIGYSPGEYLIMLRIQHASILLAQSDLSIEEIAFQSGFGNMSNFIDQIKKRTGMTPSKFRKMCKASFNQRSRYV